MFIGYFNLEYFFFNRRVRLTWMQSCNKSQKFNLNENYFEGISPSHSIRNMKKIFLPSFAIAHFFKFLEHCVLSISLVLILHCTLWAKSGRISSWMRFYTLLSLVCNIRLKVSFCILKGCNIVL